VTRNVKGVLFADYVRMIRSHKAVDWSQRLPPNDVAFLNVKIDPNAWYPMETFERFGNAILATVANNDLDAVRMWGRFSADPLFAANPALVAQHDPADTLMRFRVLRATYFDFDALEVPMLTDGQAHVVIHYYMGAMAEEAASFQTMGFFERLLEIAGGSDIEAHFALRSWAGDAKTLLELNWRSPV
jgi:hypothetical protein